MALKGGARLEHGVDGVPKLAHDGTDGLNLFEAPGVRNYSVIYLLFFY